MIRRGKRNRLVSRENYEKTLEPKDTQTVSTLQLSRRNGAVQQKGCVGPNGQMRTVRLPFETNFRYIKKITVNRVSAKAEFTNLNFTKKVRILFVESVVVVDLRKRNRFSTKYLTGRKKMWLGIICGVVPQNLKILWNS